MHINRFIVKKSIFRLMVLEYIKQGVTVMTYGEAPLCAKSVDELHKILTESITDDDSDDFRKVLARVRALQKHCETKQLTNEIL